jgi:hypothetical protein
VIRTALIQNFQAHEKLRVDFDPHVTTIVGSSDIGKSAIIRALRWVCQNFPQGVDFIREGSSGCTVKLLVDDYSVTRKRGVTGDNLYFLNDREFKAFGTGVPEPIVKLLNVNDVNFQGQHDSSFWLSLSAGEVSRQLNAVVDLSIIDTSLENINRRMRQASDQVDARRAVVEQAKIKRDELVWVEEAHTDLQAVETVHTQHRVATASAVRLRAQVHSARSQRGHQQAATQHLEYLKKVGKAASQLLQVGTQRRRIKFLVDSAVQRRDLVQQGVPDLVVLVANAESCRLAQDQIKKLYGILNPLRRARRTIDGGVPDVSGLEKVHREYVAVGKQVNRLLYKLESLKTTRRDLVEYRRRLQMAETELQEKTQGRCPVCGQPMK